MAPDANPSRRDAAQRADDQQRLDEISAALGDAVEGALPAWIERLVIERVRAWQGDVPERLVADARTAGTAARDDVVPRLRALLRADIDDQRSNPLALLRGATRHAHDVLAAHGVPPVERDEFAERSFPDDVYGLVPAAWDEIDPDLRELGITWSAAKAYVFKARRREEGRR